MTVIDEDDKDYEKRRAKMESALIRLWAVIKDYPFFSNVRADYGHNSSSARFYVGIKPKVTDDEAAWIAGQLPDTWEGYKISIKHSL
jgi:hypothetical protein